MYNFNIDYVVECVKNIRDNTKCATCDSLTGPSVRFPCGHSVCESCAEKAGECLFCIATQNNSYEVDNPQTTRLSNASALLTAFQKTFKIDVDKRQRISDQLKLEKEIFSECIQAPNKYINKRKSLNTLSANKENIVPTIYLGEEIMSTDTKMKKNQYVQNWLNQIEGIPQNIHRKPFGNINVNTQVQKGKKNEVIVRKVNTQINLTKGKLRKKTQIKATNSTSLLGNLDKQQMKDENLCKEVKIHHMNDHENNSFTYKCDRNESGIVIEDDPISVDDINVIDKDQLAWLAVLEAAKRDENAEKQSRLQIDASSKPIVNNSPIAIVNANKSMEDDSGVSRKVLFYKRSSLFETCRLCNQSSNDYIKTNHNLTKKKDVSIVINSSAFVTTIKFTHNTQNKHAIDRNNSVAVQTNKPDNEYVNNANKNAGQKRKTLLDDEVIPIKISKPYVQRLDVLPTDKVNEFKKLKVDYCNDEVENNFDCIKQSHCKIVEESDTDSNASHGNFHEVVAEVHRSSTFETGKPVLSTLSKNQYQYRCKQPLRDKTPNSSDSSDKENLDPNRNKGASLRKKQKKKK